MRNSKARLVELATLIWICSAAIITAAQREIPPAFGPYIHPTEKDFYGAKSFKKNERIVGTYYFYWYCIETREHIVNPENGSDGLQDHRLY